ncbi:lipid asymmetry maintenance protein MlaB [Vibrio sp. 10N.261.51.F12]|uniref:STAS domain-containing protein n=1 Tax=Vibrio sp. 10N.261.51.F12 TaxID=3229679 RepID=UPI00354B469A
MNASVEFSEPDTILLVGTLTRDTVPKLWKQLQVFNYPESNVNVPLNEVERIDSAGMVMLIHLIEHAKNRKCHIMLSFVPDELKMLFQLSNVESVIEKHI